MSEKVYLGDAVYAAFDGHHIVLTTENGIETTNKISLEKSVFDALIQYEKHLSAAQPQMDQTSRL